MRFLAKYPQLHLFRGGIVRKARRVGALDWNRHEKNVYRKVTHWFEIIGKILQDPANHLEL